ncbi:MAG TPA: hypothetical protein VER39_07620 [Nocardioidaceae bacterium]|nr:hypothetical protein [Nocardioidaceae bacterium]
MKLYADGRSRRTRQLLGDATLVLWVLLWLWLASVVHDATLALATPGRQIAAAGEGLADQLREAGTAVGDVPLVGDGARAPLDGAGDAADGMAAAGSASVRAIEELATLLALAVALLPVLLALVSYLPRRWRFVREATAAQRFVDGPADLDLFALRAMVSQPMHRLAAISDDPVAAWRSGDPAVVRALASLELDEAGLALPARVPDRGLGRAPT